MGASISIFRQELWADDFEANRRRDPHLPLPSGDERPAGRGTLTTSEGCSPASSPEILFLNDCARLGVPKLSMNEKIGWAKSSPSGGDRRRGRVLDIPTSLVCLILPRERGRKTMGLCRGIKNYTSSSTGGYRQGVGSLAVLAQDDRNPIRPRLYCTARSRRRITGPSPRRHGDHKNQGPAPKKVQG